MHVRQEATIDKGAEAETETGRDANFADEDGSDGAIGGPDVAQGLAQDGTSTLRMI